MWSLHVILLCQSLSPLLADDGACLLQKHQSPMASDRLMPSEGDQSLDVPSPQSQIIQMASMGRSFRLGSLYDYRSDTLVPDLLWDPDLTRNYTETTLVGASEYKYAYSDTRQSKCDLLDVSAELCFKYEAIELEGSAKVLMNEASDNHQSRVTLAYKILTKSSEVDLFNPALTTNLRRDAFTKKFATHVVTKVVYGANCVGTFSKSVNHASSKLRVEGEIKDVIRYGLIADGTASANFSKTEKEIEANTSVSVVADVVPGDIALPTSIADAMHYFKEFPKYVGDGVVVEVTLYPLVGINTEAAKLGAMVDKEGVKRAWDIAAQLDKNLLNIGDLTRMDNLGFLTWSEKVLRQEARMKDYKSQYMMNVSDTLTLIKTGTVKNDVLLQFVKDFGESHYQEIVRRNVSKLRDHITLLTGVTTRALASGVGIARSAGDVQIARANKNNVFELVLGGDSWLEKIREFATFALGKHNEEGFAFLYIHALSFPDSFDGITNTTVRWYQNTQLRSGNFTIPGKPGAPAAPQVDLVSAGGRDNEAWVLLNWTKPEKDNCKDLVPCRILRYALMWTWFNDTSRGDETMNGNTHRDETKFKVRGLHTGFTYSFQVAAITWGRGPWSLPSNRTILQRIILNETWAWHVWGPSPQKFLGDKRDMFKNRKTVEITFDPPPPVPRIAEAVQINGLECTSIRNSDSMVSCVIPQQQSSIFDRGNEKYVGVHVLFRDGSTVHSDYGFQYRRVISTDTKYRNCPKGPHDIYYTVCVGNDGLTYFSESDCANVCHGGMNASGPCSFGCQWNLPSDFR